MTTAGIVFVLTRLIAGKTESVAFMELGPDAVAVQTLVAGNHGVPRRLKLHSDSLPWDEVLPRLPSDPGLRRLRMAGGIGADPGRGRGQVPAQETPGALAALAGEAIAPVLDRYMAVAAAAASVVRSAGARGTGNGLRPPAPYRVDIVLVRRPYQWPVLDAAIDRARVVLRPVADVVAPAGGGELAAVVDGLAGYAPLRYGYELVLADVADSGTLTLRPRKLFAAGAAALPGGPRRRPTVLIDVMPVPGHAAARVALPIVAMRGAVADYRDAGVLKRERPLVAMPELDGEFQETVALKVTLRGPGRLVVQPVPGLLPPGKVPEHRAEWPELIAGLPDRVPRGQESGAGLDLVLLVELGGGDEDVAARVQLAAETVDELAVNSLCEGEGEGEAGSPVTRVAVLGYRDHFGRHRVDAIKDPAREDEALIVGCALSAPTAARSVFRRAGRWQAAPVQDFHAAPMEEALALVAGPDWEWAPDARHALVAIGGRPPHPDREGTYGGPMLPCPHRISWADAVRRLADERAVECFAVVDRPVTPGYAAQAWERLGERCTWRAAEASAAELVAAILAETSPASAEICLAMRAATVTG